MLVNKVNYIFEREDEVNFKVWCIKNHLRIKDVAAKLNVSYAYLHSILKGERNANAKILNKLKQLGFTLEV